MTIQDIGHDLEITSSESRGMHVPGTWIRGTLHGHRFIALAFEKHAELGRNELGQSRMSKLWVRRDADCKIVCNFDRGWDVEPAGEAAEIVAFLEIGLVDFVLGEV